MDKARYTGWRNFCAIVGKGKEIARLCKVIASNPDACMDSLELPFGAYADSNEKCLAQLIDVNFPGFVPRLWRYVGIDPQSALSSDLTER